MLQRIRDRAQGLVVGVIVLFICLTFALWGIQEYLDAGRRVIVADVNGEEIELGEFQDSYQRYRQQAQAVLGEEFDPRQWQTAEVRRQALGKLVEEKVLAQLVNKAGMRVSDPQVQNRLRALPVFQEEGSFSKNVYEQRVRMMGFSEVGFEQRMRTDMAVQQLQSGIAGSEFVTQTEAERLAQIVGQKRDIGYTIIEVEPFKEEINPSTQEIEDYYQQRKQTLVTDERLALEYIELSISSLMDEITGDEAVLRAFYKEHEIDFTAPEERSANHILIQVPEGAGEEEEKTARERAEKIRELARGSGDFEQLAMDNSDDVGSRAEGGATGFFTRGIMAPEFEKAVFEMVVGDISEPIRTRFGYHVIRLQAIKEGGFKSFDEVAEDVAAAYRREQAERLYFEQAEQLSNLVYEQPDTLSVASEALGLDIKATEALSAEELATRFSPAVATAAFSDEVLSQRLNSEPIETDDGSIFAIRVTQHSPVRIRSLDEVRDEVVAALKTQRARALAEERGQALIAQAKDGGDIAVLAEAQGLQWKTELGLDRTSAKATRAILRGAFRAPVPTQGASTFAGVALGTGDYAVIEVSNVHSPTGTQMNPRDVKDVKKEIEEFRAAARWRSFVQALTGTAQVETYPGKL